VIKNRRTLAYVAIALIVGAALALAVALASSRTTPSSTSSTAVQTRTSPSLLAETAVTGSTSSDPLSADPAKEQPLLDKFVSKDPFVPLAVTNSTSSGSGGSSTTTGLTAKIKVNGTSYSVVTDDKVPGGNPAFQVSAITSSDVTFAVINDTTTKSGETHVTVKLGEKVSVPLKSGKTYKLEVTSIGNSGGGSTSGHTISVLSVSETNNTALATIEVDGKTYSDKKVGAVFSTSWGDIKVIAIDVGAQTVTVMHGDQTITLRAGQVVAK
jgi:predicted RNA-binding protein with TRAM domain